jgi:hypothetical protein
MAALVACVALGAGPAHAQEEAAVVRRATELREAPGESGRSVAALPADTALTRLGERQGPWVRVKTAAGATGWVHLFDVGPASGAGSAGSSSGAAGALRSVTSFFTKPSQQRAATPTSTIGIRGLGAEDLAQAQPDAAALAKMDALRQDEAQARRFARGASLAAARVDPLPAPARAAAPANPTQAGNPGQMP